MRSTEVYKTIGDAVEPWCNANGFTRPTSALRAYQKRVGDKFLSFWFQCDRYGWIVSQYSDVRSFQPSA
jgi:hypothetical protein